MRRPSRAAQSNRAGADKLVQLLHETWKYFLVSLAALALDYGLLVALTALGHVHYLISAAVGFTRHAAPRLAPANAQRHGRSPAPTTRASEPTANRFTACSNCAAFA